MSQDLIATLKTMITPPPGTADVMVDLETMSTRADAAIVSIGACWFNAQTGDVGEPMHLPVALNSSRMCGGHIDGDTVRWWLQQSDAARAAIAAATDAQTLPSALQALTLYLHSVADQGTVRLWGNGADFDLPILASAYQQIGIKQPWAYYNGRCMRTLRKLLPHVQAPQFEGTEHNAAHDARHQARHAIALLRAIAALQGPTTTKG